MWPINIRTWRQSLIVTQLWWFRFQIFPNSIDDFLHFFWCIDITFFIFLRMQDHTCFRRFQPPTIHSWFPWVSLQLQLYPERPSVFHYGWPAFYRYNLTHHSKWHEWAATCEFLNWNWTSDVYTVVEKK